MRGLHTLGISLPLLGTGMAFPISIFKKLELATSDIVEDMKLGIELAEKQERVRFCEQAFVKSYFPSASDAQSIQRQRWEHGHLDIIQRFVPELFKKIVSGKFFLIGTLLDICIPPLSLLVSLMAIVFAVSLLGVFLFQSWLIFSTTLLAMCLFFITIAFAWLAVGKNILRLTDLLYIPLYVLSKLKIYKKFIRNRERDWVRTNRK
jgi:cellulose synthase/poly-beta-1,6-N-acetylglucosamine synthase-like glycosyltransferase